MKPTASQVYLALDILSLVPGEDGTVHKRAAEIIGDAFSYPDWTGKCASCSEYGKPPANSDPEAQIAVRTLSPIIARIVVGGDPVLLVEDLKKIIQAPPDVAGE